MTKMNLLKEELELRIDREIRYEMDDVITALRKIAEDFGIGEKADKRSPLRNILLVASEPSTSLEVIKTYIRYQVGRKEGSEVWKIKRNNQRFAEAVIDQLEKLEKHAEAIFLRVKESLPDEHSLKPYLENTEHSDYRKDLQDLHLKLVQLYLGSLVREHTALVELAKDAPKPQDNDTPSNLATARAPKPPAPKRR